MALFWAGIGTVENSLLCPASANDAKFTGKFEDLPIYDADSQRTMTHWWTWSGSNRRPLPCHGKSTTYGTDGKGLNSRLNR
jgi:hypothetical protein